MINLDSFRAAAATAKSDNIFLRLSHDGQSVKTVGNRFLERTFGFIPYHRASTYKVAREALFQAVQQSGQYQQNTIDEVAKALGLDPATGKSVQNRRLSLKTVKAILDNADYASPYTNGTPFNIPAPNSFYEHMGENMNMYIERGNDITTTDYGMIFKQTFADLERQINGFSLNGQQKVESYNRMSPAEQTALTNDLSAFFGQDQVNGLKAAKIISQFTHQGIGADLMYTLQKPDAVPMSNIVLFNNDIAPHIQFDLSRQAGVYKISCSFEHTNTCYVSDDPATRITKDINLQSGSRITFDLDIYLSFDAKGKAHISFNNSATVSGVLKQVSQEDADLCHQHASLAMSNYAMFRHGISIEPGLMAYMKTPAFQAMTDASKLSYISKNIISSPQNLALLNVIGVPRDVCKLLIAHPRTIGFKFNMDFFNRLFSQNPADRQNALAELNAELALQFQAGRAPQITATDSAQVIETAEALEKAQFKEKGWDNDYSDYNLVLNIISKMPNGPARQALITELNSQNPSAKQNVLTTLKQDLIRERKAKANEYIYDQFGVKFDNAKLVAALGSQAAVDALMDHLFAKDAQADQALKTLVAAQG